MEGVECVVRNGGKQTREIQTTSGKLKITRTVQRPEVVVKNEAGETEFKLNAQPIIAKDEYLHIENLPFKMSENMMTETADWGESSSSYESAAKKMREKCGYDMSSELIRQVTDYIGELFFEKDRENAKDIDKNLLRTPYTHEKKGVLYILVDGAVINTRRTDENGSTWRENKLGLVFNSNDLQKRNGKGALGEEIHYDIKKKEYVTYLGNSTEFKKYLYDCALRNGYGEYETTVIVSDGATWIRTMADELFPDAVQILDLFHLKENIYSFAKYLYGDDPQKYTLWAKEMITLAESSRTDELLAKLVQYKDKKLPPGSVNIYTYVCNNRSKIDYVSYRAKGYYVGSGPIESGNKVVLQRRCRQSGMRWNERCAQNMLTLCARDASGKDFVRPAVA
jgi:hypothetical protein